MKNIYKSILFQSKRKKILTELVNVDKIKKYIISFHNLKFEILQWKLSNSIITQNDIKEESDWIYAIYITDGITIGYPLDIEDVQLIYKKIKNLKVYEEK